MTPNELFAQALPLGAPWIVISSTLEGEPKKLTIEVDIEEGVTSIPCPKCGESCSIHDRRERKWRHLNFWQYETELVARVPRTRCKECGTHQIEVPWSRPGSGFTLLFEALALLLIDQMPVSAAAAMLGIYDNRLWRMLDHYVYKAHAQSDWSEVTRSGLDETSRRKGHSYVTCFVDLDTGRLLYMTEGKDAATVGGFAAELTKHQGSPDSILEVAMDMSNAFKSGVQLFLPNASKVFDRYHVMALAGAAVDKVRKEVASEAGGLETGAVWSLRGNASRLSLAQSKQRERLCRQYSKLGKALSWRDYLVDTWCYDTREAAEEHLKAVYSWGRRCRLEPIKQLCATIKRHWDGILDYYNHWTTSAVMEGLNSKLQLARKRARGYRNWKNFRTIAYWIAGGLKPATGLPNPLPRQF